MKKIATITFHHAYNYGSALQTVALQNFLKKNGYAVSVLDFYDALDMRQYKLFRTHYYFLPPIIVEDLMSLKNNKRRMESYNEFYKKHMNLTDKTFYSNEELKDIVNDYDAFICGSDQIWNTACTQGVKLPYFLNFVNGSNKLKMSYAPSIAHDYIDEKYIEDFAKEVNSIDVLSIREETGRKIIKEITGRDAEVTLDPTLLLEAEDYNSLIKPINVPKKYVYVYCLEYNKEIFKYAQKLAKEKNCELVYFRKFDIKNFKGSINSFPYGPSEFLYLIKNAEYVVTNSFHATIFSIQFEKKFITFTTKRSSSRMVDLLSKLGISNRIYCESINADEIINYTKVKEKLVCMKKNSKDFLLNNLKKKLGD